VADPITAELEAACAGWDGDRRALRRRLVKLLVQLDDE